MRLQIAIAVGGLLALCDEDHSAIVRPGIKWAIVDWKKALSIVSGAYRIS